LQVVEVGSIEAFAITQADANPGRGVCQRLHAVARMSAAKDESPRGDRSLFS
jgi:hypothetical protein